MRKILFLFFGCISFTLISAAQTATVAKDSVAIQNAQNDTAQVDTKESLSRKELDKIAKALKPVEGKALVYIVRPSGMGGLIKMTVRCDTIVLGSTKGENFVYAMLDPGAHEFESHAENRSSLIVTLEAGKTYYIKQQAKMGFAYAETGLKLLDDQEGQKELKKCKLSKDNLASK